ncbi:MAG: cyclopropane-fatty-acyl-phospholipid synthase family protein [Rhodobacter sp.]|nr:cyclopropane-fatty-acyl-phospholipid synthase family protein [Rhodobacter sp.]
MWEFLFEGFLKTALKKGNTEITLPSGRVRVFGDGSGDPVRLAFHDAATLRRLLANPELAAGEAYVDGKMTIENDDLRGFLAVVVANQGVDNLTRWQRILSRLRVLIRAVRQYNPVGKARANVAHHYDLSGALYDLFLDRDKQYSCAYFRHPDDTLEQAQAQKKAHIAQKLCLKPGMRVLDIGCGWGGMALALARDYGVHVLGVTLSEEQHKIASARAQAEGLQDRVEFRLTDYREVEETFDRIVSVGMFEHVGVPHYAEYFAHVRDKLTEDGVALIHTIGRATPPSFTSPWIAKYIFPGGYVPAMSETLKAIEKQSLWTTDIEIWRLHYAETLRHWHDRFTANRDRVKALYDERFCRMWAWYLVGAEMTFRHNRQCVFQFQLARRQDAVPLTRDYIYREPDSAEMSHAAE